MSWINVQNLNTFVKVPDSRLIKVKNLVTVIRCCCWYLEVLLSISNWFFTHRLPMAAFSNLFHTPESQPWLPLHSAQNRLMWAGLNSISATKHLFHCPSPPSLLRDTCALCLIKAKTFCTFRFLFLTDSFLWHEGKQDFQSTWITQIYRWANQHGYVLVAAKL